MGCPAGSVSLLDDGGDLCRIGVSGDCDGLGCRRVASHRTLGCAEWLKTEVCDPR